MSNSLTLHPLSLTSHPNTIYILNHPGRHQIPAVCDRVTEYVKYQRLRGIRCDSFFKSSFRIWMSHGTSTLYNAPGLEVISCWHAAAVQRRYERERESRCTRSIVPSALHGHSLLITTINLRTFHIHAISGIVVSYNPLRAIIYMKESTKALPKEITGRDAVIWRSRCKFTCKGLLSLLLSFYSTWLYLLSGISFFYLAFTTLASLSLLILEVTISHTRTHHSR